MSTPGLVGPLLAEGSVDRYRPLGAFGKPAYQSHVQLRAALLARLGKPFADYFARPTFDVEKRSLRWNAEVPGDSQRWEVLSNERRTGLEPELRRIREGLRGYVAELRASAGGQHGGGQALASLLEQAMTIPDDSHLHVIGNQPVLSFWGFERQPVPAAASHPPAAALAAAGPVVATARAPAPAPATIASAPASDDAASRRRFAWGWWPWLLPLLLLLWLVWWLRCSAPLAGWFAADGFPARWLPALKDCPAVVAVEPPKVEPVEKTAPVKVDAPTEPEPPKTEPPKTEPPKTEPPKTEPPKTEAPQRPIDAGTGRMAIPERAAQSRDLSFLEGRWTFGPRLAIGQPDGRKTGEMDNALQFDAHGRGRMESRRVGGGSCTAPARARFDGQVLRVDTERCTGNRHELVPQSMECRRGSDGRTHCVAINRDPSFRGRPGERYETWLAEPR